MQSNRKLAATLRPKYLNKDPDSKNERPDDSAAARIVRKNGKRSSLLIPNHKVGCSSCHGSAKGKVEAATDRDSMR